MYAAVGGDRASAELLLESGCDRYAVDDKGRTAKQLADEHKQRAVGDLLPDQTLAFWEAAVRGDLAMARKWLNDGADAEWQNPHALLPTGVEYGDGAGAAGAKVVAGDKVVAGVAGVAGAANVAGAADAALHKRWNKTTGEQHSGAAIRVRNLGTVSVFSPASALVQLARQGARAPVPIFGNVPQGPDLGINRMGESMAMLVEEAGADVEAKDGRCDYVTRRWKDRQIYHNICSLNSLPQVWHGAARMVLLHGSS
jgi:hypothetical protein